MNMLKRKFKPAKCKTALGLANSRLNILKNKKQNQIKVLRSELAQLLKSGETPKARIRVEHVVREQKTMAAYELIGIYCELIASRLGIIETQRNCPIDLKEAITSVVYASRSLSDVQELEEIVKQFKAKYGNDFVTSAIELRLDSGVSRLLVEKLSATPPDGPTKVKILMEIAAEYNVNWEDKSFVEPDPRDAEFLSGSSSFKSASNSNIEQTRPENSYDRSSSSSNIAQTHTHNSYDRSSSSSNIEQTQTQTSYDRNSSSSNIEQTRTEDSYDRSSSSRGHHVTSDDRYRSNSRPFGERRNSNQTYEYSSEFSDSTAAASAAAEAAERASFAARAAAELSSKERMGRQNSIASRSFYEDHPSPRMQYEDMNRNRRTGESERSEYDHRSQSSFKDRDNYKEHDQNSLFDKPRFDSDDESDQEIGFSLLDRKPSARKHTSTSQKFQEKHPNPPTSPPVSSHEPDSGTKFDDSDQDSDSDELRQVPRGFDEKVKLTRKSDQSNNFEDEFRTQEEADSDAEAQIGLKFKPLLGLKNKKISLSQIRAEVLSKSSKGQISMSSSSRKASKTDQRQTYKPPDSSSSDDDSEIEAETKTRSTFRHLHDESEEEIHKRSSFKTSDSVWYKDEEDEEDAASAVNVKPAKIGISLRTKGQEKAHVNRYDQSSPKSPDPETPLKERPSHVHPKLPDFDDLLSRLGSGRALDRR